MNSDPLSIEIGLVSSGGYTSAPVIWFAMKRGERSSSASLKDASDIASPQDFLPRVSSRSRSITLNPLSINFLAAASPAGPPPTTTMS